jgi:Thioredoxin
MAITEERFQEGLTYDEWKAQMTRNQERFLSNESQFRIEPDDLAFFKNLPQPVNVLVLAEDWCGDVIDNLPILGRLATESGRLNVRVFLRDQNVDIMDQYLNKGEFRSIPVFAFFDGQFHELGRFIERPESVTRRRGELRKEHYAQHPELGSPDTPISQMPEEARTQLMQAMSEWRDQYKGADNQEVVRSLRTILESAGS